MIRSLRWRMLIGSSIATGAILAALGVGLYASMRRALTAEFDAGSYTQAHALATMTEYKNGRLRFEVDGLPPLYAQKAEPNYFEIQQEDGRIIARSESLGTGRLGLAAPAEDVRYQRLILPDGRRGRGVALRFTPLVEHDGESEEDHDTAVPPRIIVLMARGTSQLDATLLHLRSLLGALFGLAIALSGVALLLVVTAAMRPVRRLAAQIESISERNLSQRVSGSDVPAELKVVVDRLNGLLARVENAFARERSFTADVAHELRTPIAGLHTTLEVCRSRAREPSAYEATIDRCLKMSDGLRSMIRTLLLLVRADSGQLGIERSRVSAETLLAECWASFVPRTTERGAHIEWVIDDRILQTDIDKLKMIVNNLFDNAVSYVETGGSIRIESFGLAGEFVLTVTNTGSKITETELSLLTERFWRGDASRTDTGLHCGLGLSLCHRLATLIGGRLTFKSKDGSFVATLSLPQAVVADEGAKVALAGSVP